MQLNYQSWLQTMLLLKLQQASVSLVTCNVLVRLANMHAQHEAMLGR
jgi:hypothetical protein